jgi:pimeloyl-ACP methyl ester carboxylesterase
MSDQEARSASGARPSTDSLRAYQAQPAINERTRLISSDDEAVAVTPYNLFIVRSLRRMTVFFLFISILWWIFNLVLVFVSVSNNIHSRGSGFTQLSFATISVFLLLFNLMFFSTPSKADRIVALSMSVFLMVNFVMIMAIGRLRTDEGWIGIASVIWTMLMGFFVVMTDRVVEYGKEEEEERLLGHVQTRRTLGEWCKVFVSLFGNTILLLVVILTWLTLVLRAHDATLPAPGKKVWVDNSAYQVHVDCIGNASSLPTVLLESGENSVEYGLLPWALEAQTQYNLGRVCYWDRPGYGWSDNAPSPSSAGTIADALSEALIEAEVSGPFVVAAHGIGGVYARIFASRHAKEIKGLLLVDTLHEDLLGTVGNAKNSFFLFIRGFLSPLGIDRLVLWIFGGRSREDRTFGRTAYRGGRWTRARLQESLAMPLTHNELLAARAILPDTVPITIVAAGKEVRRSKTWESKQYDLSRLSKNGKIVVVEHTDHSDILKRPEGTEVLRKQLASLVKADK